MKKRHLAAGSDFFQTRLGQRTFELGGNQDQVVNRHKASQIKQEQAIKTLSS
jgi:hypothetical protein